MNLLKKTMSILNIIVISSLLLNCSKSDTKTTTPVTPPVTVNEVDCWLTKGDQSIKLQKQSSVIGFNTNYNSYPKITVDVNTKYQTIDGFGFTLTGGSAQVINQLNSQTKQDLLQELFGTNQTAVSINYIRLSIGASDLNDAPFTYDDMPAGQTDLTLSNFNLSLDTVNLLPLLKQIVAINPAIKIIAAPWSAPVWMKDNNSFVGGSLQTKYYNVYAQYFVKYIQAMKAQGITIDAITPQNEPLNPYNNPSLVMTASQQTGFIKDNLGPAFQTAGIATKIVVYDHNCDRADYPTAILNDAAAAQFVNGSAFHLYAGDINALSGVHNSFPNKNIYFTEQYTASNGNFSGDLKWHLKNVMIGAMRNWSKNALEWNLANNSGFGPHTNGGCSSCLGALTVDGTSSVIRNVGYYIVSHLSKFVPAGSIRIDSNTSGDLNNVAFITPQGKIVLVVENDAATSGIFSVSFNGKWFTTSLDAGAVATYIW